MCDPLVYFDDLTEHRASCWSWYCPDHNEVGGEYCANKDRAQQRADRHVSEVQMVDATWEPTSWEPVFYDVLDELERGGH